MVREKVCHNCKRIFPKDPRVNPKQWVRQKYCSHDCRTKGKALEACIKRGFGPGTSYYQTIIKYNSISAAAKQLGVHARTLERRLWIENGFCGSCGIRKINLSISVDKCELCFKSWKQCEKSWRHSEEGQQYNYQYVRTDDFREKHKVVAQRYFLSDKGQAWHKQYIQDEENKKRHNLVNQQYYKTEKGQKTSYAANVRRRERSYNFDCPLTQKELQLIRDSFDNRCFICQMTQKEHKQKYGKQLHIDHFNPLSRGHGLTLDNSVLLCRGHNISKLAKDPNDFFTTEQILKLKEVWKEMLCQRARKVL